MNNLFFTLEGDANKPTIVFGHPLGMNSQAWDSIVPHFKEQFHILRWDLPGHGKSAAIDKSVNALSEESLVAPLLAKCNELGIKQFHYVGTSIGGMIGQQLLASHPERLLSVTLTNTGSKIGTQEGWLTRQKEIMSQGLPAMASTLVLRWFSEDSINSNPTLAPFWQSQLAQVDDHSYGLLCTWLGQRDLTQPLSASRVPTQLICGEKDIATPPSLMKELASLLHLKNIEVCPKVGHVPSVEAPNKLAKILKNCIIH